MQLPLETRLLALERPSEAAWRLLSEARVTRVVGGGNAPLRVLGLLEQAFTAAEAADDSDAICAVVAEAGHADLHTHPLGGRAAELISRGHRRERTTPEPPPSRESRRAVRRPRDRRSDPKPVPASNRAHPGLTTTAWHRGRALRARGDRSRRVPSDRPEFRLSRRGRGVTDNSGVSAQVSKAQHDPYDVETQPLAESPGASGRHWRRR